MRYRFLLPVFLFLSAPAAGQSFFTPPPGDVRTPAEWEEIQALVITWASQFPILAQIADYAQEECEVVIVCNDSTVVRNYLLGQGITPVNISYIVAPFNRADLAAELVRFTHAEWSACEEEAATPRT